MSQPSRVRVDPIVGSVSPRS